MPTYSAPGIVFARATDSNLAIARSSSGGNESDITDRINPVSLATGKISTTPGNITGTFSSFASGNTVVNGLSTQFVNEVDPGDKLYYLSSGSYTLIGTVEEVSTNIALTLTEAATVTPSSGATLAVNNNIITGTGTEFTDEFSEGDYIFYYDATGTPFLLGRASVVSSAQITLTGKWQTAVLNKNFGGINVIVSGSESFLIRIPVVPNGSLIQGYPTQVYVPSWASFRQSGLQPSSYNNTTVSNIQSYSSVGDPTSASNSPQNVDYAITPLNVFNTTGTINSQIVWPAINTGTPRYADFPNFMFALFNPYGSNQDQNMAQNTMFKIFCQTELDGYLASPGTLVSALINVGYSPSQFIGQGVGGGAGSIGQN
jgi:hypothetical protein